MQLYKNRLMLKAFSPLPSSHYFSKSIWREKSKSIRHSKYSCELGKNNHSPSLPVIVFCVTCFFINHVTFDITFLSLFSLGPHQLRERHQPGATSLPVGGV
uniref:Uncharacterized protein n=1 Tax=Rousettus aegyptiacus TaxID=9407 RepID=A0A7J8H9A6_ROUAE|nr:hypothetical protein HJG63_020554 [Rousettus aegyptiacus]